MTLRSYDINEMLGTKLRAMKQRRQGRDLFDLWWALQARRPGDDGLDPAKIVAAFGEYMRREGTRITREEFRRDLAAKLQIPEFRHDMDGKLRPGFGAYDVDTAAQIVGEVLLARLPE